jgi:hypothetical protein
MPAHPPRTIATATMAMPIVTITKPARVKPVKNNIPTATALESLKASAASNATNSCTLQMSSVDGSRGARGYLSFDDWVWCSLLSGLLMQSFM